ncbi:alpha/beta hydrolase [Persicitalea jodogahamensis]|uniref:Alpha/beta hydrolase n=2 Tax=Persicitalea jodogahamensis TaxID=402147 RepID=A0A8J3GA00_9BACT|nr:alpha/beta hydrolase [Persicitalea jodogahamensis]
MILSMSAKGVDEEIFESNAEISVDQMDETIAFAPTKPYDKIVIFFPGALVDPDAYAPLCRKIAEEGSRVLICKMPFRLATRGYNDIKETDILDDPTKQYILMGHSQGAKMAAQFVYENPGVIDKLILLGTTHPRDIDLSGAKIPILKISGANDGVADLGKVNRNKPKLPSSTKYVTIEGANHSQFGYYGFQLGDSKATISRDEQQALVLENVLAFIE